MLATTTLSKIWAYHPHGSLWNKLLACLGKTKADNELLPLANILESSGVGDAVWCLRASDASEDDMRDFTRWCALQVIHLWDAPPIVREYLETGDESKRAAASDATYTGSTATARAAAMRAAHSAASEPIWDPLMDADDDAATAAAMKPAEDETWSMYTARAVVGAWTVAKDAQTQKFKQMFCTEIKA